MFKSHKSLAVLSTAMMDQGLQFHYELTGFTVDIQNSTEQGIKSINQSIKNTARFFLLLLMGLTVGVLSSSTFLVLSEVGVTVD